MNTKASKLAEIHEIYAYAMEARDHIMTALNEINQLERQTVTDDKRPFHLHPHPHQPPLLPFNDMDAIMNRLVTDSKTEATPITNTFGDVPSHLS